MKILTRILLLLVIIYPVGALGATGNISKVVFTTEEQTISPGSVSGAITIQLQNNDGGEEKLDDTADITFISNGSGEFLGSTGKLITKTMSKGSANKTFYYKDNNAGTYTLKVTVIPRFGGGEWSESQQIVVGDGGSGSENNIDTDEDNSEEESTSSQTSSHSNSAKLSTYQKSSSVKVGAGRPRTVLVKTPIYFEPETNESKNIRSKKGEFTWSFGDGEADSGRIVKHIYYFAGDYNVILNTNQLGEEIVSRTKVKVIEPSLEVVNVVPGEYGYVEIKNKNNLEVNINGWGIKSGKREYHVAEDTIINPRSSIKIPNRVMHFSPGDEVSFIYPNDEVYVVYESRSPQTSALVVPIDNNFYYQPLVQKTEQSESVPKETVLISEEAPAAVSSAKGTSRIIQFIKSIFTVH